MISLIFAKFFLAKKFLLKTAFQERLKNLAVNIEQPIARGNICTVDGRVAF